MKRLFARSTLLLVSLALSAPVFANEARTFSQTTQKDFEEGEVIGTTVLPAGEVVPGFESQKLPLEAAFVWSSARSPDGGTAYFGTGDEGKIFAVPTAAPGQGGKDNVRLLAKLEEPWVTALAVLSDGSLLAATTPGARLSRVDVKTGKVTAFARIEADHVWALVHDAKSGLTYAATGGPGGVTVIDRAGKARVLWDAQDQHVVSLVDGGGGNLLAGSSDRGILYRIQPNGTAVALHDFESEEVRAIARQGDTLFVAANDFGAAGAIPVPANAKPSAQGTKVDIVASGRSPAAPGRLPRPGAPKAKGAIYRLLPDGSLEQLFALSEGYFTALLSGDKGAVYAAAGSEGKVYRIDADRSVSLVLDLPERQALTLVAARPVFMVGTGDSGTAHRVGPVKAGKARYLSRVFDAQQPARWGQLRYGADRKLALETRSGSTAKPDGNWESWKPLASTDHKGLHGEGRVASAPARYLQYRATLPAEAVLRDATVFYLPHNQRARVSEFGDESRSGPPRSGDRQHEPVLKLRWKVENPDGDALIYRLSYRPEGGQTPWRPLSGPEPLGKPEYDWDTNSVPDGHYTVRVWLSDERAVAQDRALSDEYVSPPLLVDNTRPEVGDLEVKLPVITGSARDAASPIVAVEFSVDGGPFVPVAPTDGILDQKREAFSLRLSALGPGPHVVNVRAYDAAHNVGVARVVVNGK